MSACLTTWRSAHMLLGCLSSTIITLVQTSSLDIRLADMATPNVRSSLQMQCHCRLHGTLHIMFVSCRQQGGTVGKDTWRRQKAHALVETRDARPMPTPQVQMVWPHGDRGAMVHQHKMGLTARLVAP